ncbi:polysaccharide deacetylase [Labilithrix luteola]|uniref:Polysaccharide deacetylase n=1 Tax=Labilithrix luteola TaxID=1391654 RepID=A0A0K1Q602_9BACT|nr:polysaccharide deacetylase family protein [Labilithrix luteola]AKV01159.1 polysaccharide deacetylase [Labilithrix luteola]
MSRPALVISLDFELHWGVRDHTSVDGYRANLLGVREAIPAMLDLFERKSIAATWATVGFLFAENKKDLERHVPSRLPTYDNRALSPYDAIGEIGDDEASDPFHYAPSLVRHIAKTPRQELATHTFSHYYCLEAGQTAEQFDADLEAAAKISSPYGDAMRSIVFPRNQLNERYADVLRQRGIRAYRSNGRHWAYRAERAETPARRAFRLADAYLPLGGPRLGEPSSDTRGLTDVPASAFLRPYSPRLRRLDPLRRHRLERTMTSAAKSGRLFHLWWHPHNFGKYPKESMAFLERLLDHFETLRRRYGMESLSMGEAAAGG